MVASRVLILRGRVTSYCQWNQVTMPGRAFAYPNVGNNLWLTYNGSGSNLTAAAQVGTIVSSTMQCWTLSWMEDWGAQAVRPYTEITQNLSGFTGGTERWNPDFGTEFVRGWQQITHLGPNHYHGITWSMITS